MYREEQSGGGFMLGMLTGAFVGAGLALLFAPKAGNEMRAQLGEQYRGIADRRRADAASAQRRGPVA
jgi:gas vesicle protein